MAEMTYLRSPKLWLLSTAALILGSQISASAQIAPNYHSGAPTMVAAAPSLPNISPEQIARDVVSEFNPRTGRNELIAAPFDPFEQDPALAASLRLRSADGAVAIDGYPLRDGALVEIDFYYNSPSDDPYGGRNYGEAAFVNGDLAPVVKRDTRIIECSTRVENVIYEQARYYGGGYPSSFYRPYRHYTGHSAFGFGFGNSYFGPGYRFFDSSRISFNLNSFGGRRISPSRITSGRSFRNRRSNRRNRILNRDRQREQDIPDAARLNFDGETAGTANSDVRRENIRRVSNSDFEERANRVQRFDAGINRADVRRNPRNSAIRASFNAQPRVRAVPAATHPVAAQPSTARPATAQPATAPAAAAPSAQTQSNRRETRRSQPRRTDSNRSSARRDSANRRDNRRSETRSNSSRSRSNRVKKSPQTRRISPNGNKRQLNFFPDAGYGGRGVVTSHSVDCAREDKLTVFIPNDRLDAARFDGLTLVALDAQGGEAPIYLPPNYIEGFRLAATGQVRPQGNLSAPPQQSPPIGTPIFRDRVEPAPCPAGTSKQPDGTCLQSGSYGYPQ